MTVALTITEVAPVSVGLTVSPAADQVSLTITEVAPPSVTLTVTEGGRPGQNGSGGRETFETISKNLAAYPATILRVDGALVSLTYDLGGGLEITKTLGRVAGVLTTITLSGDTPDGIDLVKTLTRDGSGNVTGATYGSA
jgi:hypothetical protein